MAPSERRKGPSSEELREVRNRELEIRRISGEISCADCRRLKLKCDKKIPCSSCVRRGTELLCPLGARGSAGSHSARSSLAGPSAYSSQRDKRKLTLLIERIHALEDALALESEARGGSGSHPLLTEESLAVKRSAEKDDGEGEQEEEDVGEDHVLGEFGTLTIDDGRAMRYLGPGASESALVMEILEGATPRLPIASPTPNELNPEIVASSRGFPFSSLFLSHDTETLFCQLVTYLPPYERATALYEAYFSNLAWFNTPVERIQFVQEIIPTFYPRRKPVVPTHVRAEHAHELALLYVLFACGAAGDLTQSPTNDEGEKYFNLAKASLSVKGILQSTSMPAVQAVFLLGAYGIHSGRTRNEEEAWKLVAFGASLAASIGLHRDPARWGFSPKMIERRRRAFWEIYALDLWKGLESGRPALFRPNIIDCELPTDTCVTLSDDGEPIESIMQWRYRFCRDVVSDICERVTSSRPLRYRDVLDLDRRIRNFPTHPFVNQNKQHTYNLGIDADFIKVYPLVTTWEMEESLLYIHRNFFARAILDFPDNPMRSPFAVSFLATYRSAVTVIRICRDNLEHIYLITLRIWEIWTLCLTCGVVVGSVASLGPSVSFATSAFVELEYVIAIFEKYNDHIIAKHGLPLLRKIREKAVEVLRRPRSGSREAETGDTSRGQTNMPVIRTTNDNATKELLILHGTTRVVEQRTATPSDSNRPTLQAFNESQGASFLLEAAATARSSSHTGSPVINERPVASPPGQGITSGPANIPSGTFPDPNPNSSPISTFNTTATDTWLMELEKLLGTGFPQPFPFGGTGTTTQFNQNQGQSPPPPQYQPNWATTTTASSYPMKTPDFSSITATATLNVPFIPFVGNLPTPSLSSSPLTTSSTTTEITPEMLLNETVSTEDWRQFMQQSGLSDTPPFDFTMDTFTTPPPPNASNVDCMDQQWLAG